MVALDLGSVTVHDAPMSVLTIIGVLLVLLGLAILLGLLGGDAVAGVIALLVGIALLAAGSGRLRI